MSGSDLCIPMLDVIIKSSYSTVQHFWFSIHKVIWFSVFPLQGFFLEVNFSQIPCFTQFNIYLHFRNKVSMLLILHVFPFSHLPLIWRLKSRIFCPAGFHLYLFAMQVFIRMGEGRRGPCRRCRWTAVQLQNPACRRRGDVAAAAAMKAEGLPHPHLSARKPSQRQSFRWA